MSAVRNLKPHLCLRGASWGWAHTLPIGAWQDTRAGQNLEVLRASSRSSSHRGVLPYSPLWGSGNTVTVASLMTSLLRSWVRYDPPGQTVFSLGHWNSIHFTECMLSYFSCVQLFVTLWTVARQAPLSMGFSRQEYWNGLPCPPPGDPLNPGIEPASPVSPALAGGFFTTSASWEALSQIQPIN